MIITVWIIILNIIVIIWTLDCAPYLEHQDHYVIQQGAGIVCGAVSFSHAAKGLHDCRVSRPLRPIFCSQENSCSS